MMMTSSVFADGWVRPVPTTQDIVKDGVTAQYLYNVSTGSFMLGANDYETRGSASRDKGMPWKIQEQTDGTYALVDSVAKFKEWRKTFVESNAAILTTTMVLTATPGLLQILEMASTRLVIRHLPMNTSALQKTLLTHDSI